MRLRKPLAETLAPTKRSFRFAAEELRSTLLREADPAQEVLEARVGAQRIAHRLHTQIN